MAVPSDNSGRVGQGKYWTLFGIYMIVVPVLLIGGVIAIFQGSFATGMLLIAAIIPAGLYFRVIMMRRCRDIGWPAFLPWLIFGAQIVVSIAFPLDPEAVTAASLSMVMLPLALGLFDFVFMIVIGCIGTKRDVDYETVFGDGPAQFQKSRPAGAMPSDIDDPDRYDDAIARALEAHRRGESVVGAAPAPRAVPAMPGRPAVSFGRRVI